ncbi:MAG: 2-hydroxyacid dehydrogenase [Saezia sp.]
MTQTAQKKPKIVVSGRIFDEQLQALKECYEVIDNQANAFWASEQLVAHLKGAEGALVTLSDKVTKEVISQCPHLKVICNIAVGYNNIDVAACTERGIVCTNTPDVLTQSTADLGFALMMAAARRITEGERYLRAGHWKQPLALDAMNGGDLYKATLGIIGMGRIGRAVARRGVFGFDMKLVYHNRSRLDLAMEKELNATYATKDEVLATADHVVLVMPYRPENHHLIGRRELDLMKPSATLTNIARGGIVDENALADVLEVGKIAAAALDVYEGEPNVNPRLLKLGNIVMTPHIGSASTPTRRKMCQLAIDNLEAVLSGRSAKTPVN